MAIDPVDFTTDAGDPGYSAKVNRLIRQDVRMGRPMGVQFLWIGVPGGTLPIPVHACRFRYHPQRNPYDRLFIVRELAFELGNGSGVPVIGRPEYTIDDGNTWIEFDTNPAFPQWTAGNFGFGSFDLDLSAIVAPTWVGVRQTFGNSGAGPYDFLLRCFIAFLYRAAYPPF